MGKKVGMDDQTTQNQDDQNNSGAASGSSSVKKRALEALLPLLDNLDESPDRKFEILMTAVRSATDDESVLEKALEAALSIEEPAAKAEALLDIINEASFRDENR